MDKPRITIFDLSEPLHRTAAELFEGAQDLPLICPHTHVDPHLFADADTRFADPAAIFVTGDHYVVRMLVSLGVTYEQLGVSQAGRKAVDPQAVWQVFCDHFDCFDGTPTGLWTENSLAMVFGIHKKPNTHNAAAIYTQIQSALADGAFSPRSLYDRFNIEVVCTTDSAADPLILHQEIRTSGWHGQVRPTFRPDSVLNIAHQDWHDQIAGLSWVSNVTVKDYGSFIQALEVQRSFFKDLGAVSIDFGAETAFTCRLSDREVSSIFRRALQGKIHPDDAKLFSGHMVVELARMSVEDGLVMQFHVGSYRNHSSSVFQAFGTDKGFDIPVRVEWTHNLRTLLDAFGMDHRLQLILFTLDEGGYARELAPLAGAYPAVKLGPPWWFNDSSNGIMRYFESVMETAGIDNTVGFNDDTRTFLSIPARHDLWRRMAALWLAKLVHRGQLDMIGARQRMADLAFGLAKKGYRLG